MSEQKIALCLHGYFGTLSENNFETSAGGYEHIKERLLSNNINTDVFVHCWQPEYESKINEYYQPVESKLEKQIDFDAVCKLQGISQSYIDEGFPRNQTMYRNAIASRILSFYYSRCEALNMAINHAKKNGFEYDWIVTTRFDISQRGGSEVNLIRFHSDQDNSFLYTTFWNQMNAGYGDMWFYGSQKVMSDYSNIYQSALADFTPNSKYEEFVTKLGVLDSQMFNWYDSTDYRQFSNEVLKPQEQKSKQLMRFPRWRITDSHLHHKWFCIKSGLYEKTRWV
jgi:hypothetical protein